MSLSHDGSIMTHSRFKKSLWAFCAFAIGTGAINAVWNSQSVGAPRVDSRQIYRGMIKDEVKSFDPAIAFDPISLSLMPGIFEALYQYKYTSDEYVMEPLLASDLPTISNNRLKVMIPIKAGVKFHDDAAFAATKGKGRELKAQDFVYAFKRLADPKTESSGWWIFDKKIKGLNEFREKLSKASNKEEHAKIFASEIAGLKALDDRRLQIQLTQPYPQLLYILAMSFTAPMAHEVVAKYGDSKGQVHDHPVGTGPFYLKKWDHGFKITLARNPTYHPEFYPIKSGPDSGKPLPFLDEIQVQIMREQQPAWLGFLRGEIDYYQLPKDSFEKALKNRTELSPGLKQKGIKLRIETGVVSHYLLFNTKVAVLNNKYLRQAISSAIDRERWIDIFTSGRAKKATTALPPGIPDRVKNAKLKYDFDLVRAKELLKKAGYPEGKGLPQITLDMRGADTITRQLGDFFTKQLAAIGVNLNVTYNTLPMYLEKAREGGLQMAYGAWSMDYPDPQNMYQLLYGRYTPPGPNLAQYDHPEMNKLYEKMAVMEAGPERAAVIAKMDQLLQEETPWVLGYHHVDYQVLQPWLFNYHGTDIIMNKYKYLRVDNEIKAQYKE